MKKKNISLGFIVLSLVAILLIIPVKAKTEEFSPTEDAYINNSSPNNNYGASHYLHIGTFSGGFCVTYLKFQIPVNERRVLSASVSTYWYNYQTETWLTVQIGTADNGWSETSITWNNAPYYYFEIITTASITDRDYLNFDVLGYIPASGAFSVIIFEYSNTGESLQGDSSENDFLTPEPPVLTIEYELILADYLPYIIGGVVGGIAGVGAIIGVVIYLKRKKRAREPITIQKPLPKFCTSCGTPVEDEFCTNCGKPIYKVDK